METKPRLLSIVGTFLIFSGALTLLTVLAVWQLAPLFPPENYGENSTSAYSRQTTAADTGPALSPYFAPQSDIVSELPLLPSSPVSNGQDNGQEEFQPIEDGSLAVTLQDWRELSYPEGNGGKAGPREAGQPGMRMLIPALDLEAPIVPVALTSEVRQGSRPHQQWTVPNDFAAGWHETSARPGQSGNMVLNGHNNIHGAIFQDLVDLPLGAQIVIYDADQSYEYRVTGREFLKEQGESLRNRLRNARWIMPTDDERMTLVTCWPNTSNSHRLVVIAQPVH